MKLMLTVQRVYEQSSVDDECRLLVDRVWPRGVKRDSLNLTAWLPEIAPSTELRKWFGHDPAKWAAFQDRYGNELDENPALESVLEHLRHGPVTLLYSARDTDHNQAVALAVYITSRHSDVASTFSART